MCGGAVLWLIRTSIPWWVPIIGMTWGIILGLWSIRSGYNLLNPGSNKIFSSLKFFGFYISFRIISDLLAWRVIPQEPYHLLFDMGVLLSIAFGWLFVVIPAIIGRSRING